MTDKLHGYETAQRAVMPSARHDTRQYANNRAEVAHQVARQRERQMRRFKFRFPNDSLKGHPVDRSHQMNASPPQR